MRQKSTQIQSQLPACRTKARGRLIVQLLMGFTVEPSIQNSSPVPILISILAEISKRGKQWPVLASSLDDPSARSHRPLAVN